MAGNTLAILFFGLVLNALTVGEARAATSIDLGVSAHTWTPDPIVRGGSSTFTITVTNNDMVSAADTLTLAVDLPTNVDFTGQAAPANCAFNLAANPNTLTCTRATLAAQGTWSVSFDGVGATAGVQTTTATVSSATNTDPNGGNDASTKNTTVTSGADLAVTKTGPGGCVTATPCNTTAGSTIGFTVHVANNGPDPATTFRVTDNLPATADFTYQSAVGSGWTCGVSGTTLTCDYSGANVASGAAAPDITVTGVVITSAGTITNGASVASTDGVVGDPVPGNNGPSLVVVNVAPGTSLRANKTMVSAATGMTSFATGEAVNLTLSATNLGPQNATGVTVTDTVSADFTIGVLPAGCTAVGRVITCTVGALSNGVTSTSFVIPLTVVGAAGNSGTNTANVARATPASGNNTPASVNYTLTAPFAHLTIAKIKTPTPVAAGADITNTITVTNSNTSTSAATGVIRVTDALDANENFVSFSGSGWSCSGVAVGATGTVTCDYAGANLARGASLPALVIVTQAAVGYLGTISNTACTGLAAGSPHVPADNGSSCQSRSVTGSHRHVDLTVAKSANIAAPTHVLTTDNSVAYTLVVSNAGPDVAPTVNVSDPIPGWYNGTAGTTGGSAVITGAVAGESCTFASTVTCTLKDVASGSPRTITITLNRPFGDGSFTNNASVSTPDAIDDVPGNNTGSASIIVDAIADVAVTNVASSPDPVKVGVQLTYTTSIKNNGPSTAAGVVLRHTIDPAKMTYVAASASLTTGGSCSYVASFVGAPYAGQAGIECNGFTLANGESRQLTFSVIPVYPYPGGVPNSYASAATITTTTVESDAPGYANNSFGVTSNIAQEAIDLSVTDNDPGYDPTAFGDSIVYQVKAQNNGPSQATGLKLTVTPTPPAQGAQANPYTMAFNAAGSTLPGGATCSQPGGAGTDVVCYLGADQANSVQAPNSSNTFNLMFDTGPLTNAPPSSITYRTTVKVESYETGASPFAGDSLAGNNSVTETTTVLPKTDLHVANKTVSKPVVDLNETFTYTIVVGNKGPSDASGARMTDVLPAGLVRTAGAIVVTQGSGVALTVNSCSGPASGANGTVICDLGPIPADATGADATKQVSIAIPVRAAYQASGTYSFAFNTNIGNTASIAPLPNTSIDVVAGNNTNTVNVQVRKNSIAGYVYTDNNLDDTMDAAGAEGLGSVTLTLTGTDSYGYTYGSGMNYAARTTTTSATAGVNKGSFLFDKLPPGNWTIVETQPANYWDRFETAGTAGGTAPAATCNGSTNCAATAAANTISAIALPVDTATAATGYIFQEYQRAQISGTVYSDANNDGVKAASGEPGIQSATVTLSGTAYNGLNVCSLVTCAATTNASGAYGYANLPPADAGGYTLTETQPGAYLNGLTIAGTVTGVNAVAGTATGANSNVIQAIKVYANGNSPNNNFGELQPIALSGFVFSDPNTNAVKDGGETTGITTVTITLTGTDDLGAVNTSTTTGVSGAYSFANLRPGVYTVTETQPAGLTHTGAQAGSKGGTIAGSVRAANIGVAGAANMDVSAITLAAGDNATGYNFGESGQGLSGFVYLDLNANGVKDAGEPGIAGVSVTLSGLTTSGQDVCAAISPNPCSMTTDAGGAYSFTSLPGSNGSGYTLTEQLQTVAPLNNFADGQEQLGTGLASPGTVGSDSFSGIVVPVGGSGVNYNFGELGATLSGAVYYDANDNGAKEGGESGLGSVTLTLSGTTASGANVCTILTSLGQSCTATSATDGTFAYIGLPASDATGYLLVETQLTDYANRSDSAGTGCGTASCGTASVSGGNSRFATIKLAAGANAVNYLFGEKAGSIRGTVFADHNNNGTQDAGELGIAGVALTLSGTTASGANVCTATALHPNGCSVTTDGNGAYVFSGLRNANGSGYTVTETQPAAYLDGLHVKGLVNGVACAACSIAVNDVISGIAFNAADTHTAYNFGELAAASIAGNVYRDSNNNAVFDSGEAIAGVTLTLTGTNDLGAVGPVTASTAANGSYSFTGLRPGTYKVTETQPGNIGDYPGASGSLVGTVGGSGVGVAALNEISAIALNGNSNGVNYNFRENISGLSGTVYYDADANGALTPGEGGIAGVAIRLTGTDGNGNAVDRSVTTAADGGFNFGGLSSGTYTLTETQPSDYADGAASAGSSGGTASGGTVIGSIVLAPGATGANYLFGEKAGSIRGIVFADHNNNGTQDAGEPGIAGVALTLSGTTASGANVCTTTALHPNTCTATTDGNGAYVFSGLRNANGSGYTVTETQPAAYLDGLHVKGLVNGVACAACSIAVNDVISGIAFNAADTHTAYNFGELAAASIAGNVYRDSNNNAVFDSGEAIAGVTLTLTGTNDLGAVGPVTVSTAANGSYSFTGLRPGTYKVTETQPGNIGDYPGAGGSLVGTVGGSGVGVAALNEISAIALNGNSNGVNYNFRENISGLSGTVYYDADANGALTPGEGGIAGVAIRLTGTDGNGNAVDRSVTTAADGGFNFGGLSSGTYTLTETQPADYADGATAAGSSGGTASGGTIIGSIVLAPGATGANYLFGEKAGSIRGTVFADHNNNGTQDAGEPGIAGVALTLSGTTASGANVCTATALHPNGCTATTDANGAYVFSGLRNANATGYTVTETQPAAYLDGLHVKGLVNGVACAACSIAVNDVISGIAFNAADSHTAYNFGELAAASIAGNVYRDSNNNAVFDSGEAIAGVTLTLTGTNDLGAVGPVATTTAANGSYSFTGLRPGTYRVTETQPGNIGDYPGASGSLVGTVGGSGVGVAALNEISAIALNGNSNGIDYNFRENISGLSGTVYYDADANGALTPGEGGIAGVAIRLTGTDGNGNAVDRSMTTAADGGFNFGGLSSGTYTLTETQPADYADGAASAGSSGGTASGGTIIGSIVLAPGATGANYLFGEKAGAIRGTVFADHNNNGTQEAGETGIAGVALTLSGTTASGANVCTTTALHPNTCTATTDGNGAYVFSGLRNANATGYTVSEQAQNAAPLTAYLDGMVVAGSGCGSCSVTTTSPNSIQAIPFRAATAFTAYNFAELVGAGISGRVYHDNNNNSVYEAGEEIAAVTLTLTGVNDLGAAVNVSVQTGADGSYSFAGLRPSDNSGYTITETQPTGYGDFSTPLASSGTMVGTIAGVAKGTAALNAISAIVLPPNSAGSNYDFREQGSGIQGFVYRDDNDDGVKDATEPGLSGITVTLKDAGGVTVQTAITAADGAYSFDRLLGGTYTLEETPPAGLLDGKETAGSAGGTVDNTAFDNTAAKNSIVAINLPPATVATGYLFGERGGILNGTVYADINKNGAMDTGEVGIPGIDVTLSGVSATGVDIVTLRGCVAVPANCVATTTATGAFSFDGIPPGTYSLVENQNQVDLLVDAAGAPKYADGMETAGVAGGVVDNVHNGSQAGFNTIGGIAITSAVITANAGNIGGYLFGEVPRVNNGGLVLLPPIISGYVYHDANHDRLRDAPRADAIAAGWTVTLTATRSDGATEVICAVTTDSVGFYHLDNVACAANYPQWSAGLPISGSATATAGVTYTTFAIGFSNPNEGGVTTAPQSGGNVGNVLVSAGQITNITLRAGDDLTEQNLPLDPSGVVYDALTRQPVAGAQVQILSGGAPVPAACISSGQNTVTTGANGFYQFLLLAGAGCPGSATYTLAVTPPAGYAPGVSTMIPPQPGTHTPGIGGVDPIQVQNTAPGAAQATTYFLGFNLTLTGTPATSSSEVVNNHIPVDPISPGQILVTKTTPLVNVARGDLVPYTITAFNTLAAPLTDIAIHDLLPPGFKYRRGSGTVNGVAMEPVVNGRDLTWNAQSFAGNGKNTYKLILVVGSGVSDGAYVNQAYALRAGTAASNIASATVRVTPDPVFDCSDIIGKVFDDVNANGYQDDGEPGIPNVRMATARGLLVTSDADGRFHVACAAIPQADRGSNFAMKLDERTLPSGYRLTTENPRDARVTRGKMAKLNFGATIHRVVRLDITDGAFDGEQLKPEWLARLQAMPEQLKGRPSVLRLAYKQGLAGEELAAARLKAVSAQLRELWNEKACCHALLIEEEIVQPSVVSGEGR